MQLGKDFISRYEMTLLGKQEKQKKEDSFR